MTWVHLFLPRLHCPSHWNVVSYIYQMHYVIWSTRKCYLLHKAPIGVIYKLLYKSWCIWPLHTGLKNWAIIGSSCFLFISSFILTPVKREYFSQSLHTQGERLTCPAYYHCLRTILGSQCWYVSVFHIKTKAKPNQKYPVVQWEKLFEFIQSALSPFLSSRLYWLSPLLHRNMHVLTWSSSYPVSFLLWLYTKPKIKMIKSHTCFPVSAAYCILLPGD